MRFAAGLWLLVFLPVAPGGSVWLAPVKGARSPLAPSAAPVDVPDEWRHKLVEEINRDRQQAGLPSVVFSPELSAAADAHCREMVREGYTSHWNRAGLKPYIRYALAGLRDATSENVASFWCSGCNLAETKVLEELRKAHRRFMAETPPDDGHLRSILDPNHTHVGVGVAWSATELRLIEVFAARHAELDPMPPRGALNSGALVRGRVRTKGLELNSISIFYEPLPRPLTLEELKGTYDYGLPQEERRERPQLDGPRTYVDGSRGTVLMGAGQTFQVPLVFWKSKPGVYTVVVWVRRGNQPAFAGAQTSVVVEK